MAKAKNILALDLATVTGWAWGKPGETPKFGQQRFGKPLATRPQIYKQYRLWLGLFCSAHKIDWIVYESPQLPFTMTSRTNIGTIRLLIGLCELLEEWAPEHDIELREASVSQVRCHFIGANLKRDLAKRLTIERCKAMGWDVQNDDQGDALALWHYQACLMDPILGTKSTPLFQD